MAKDKYVQKIINIQCFGQNCNGLGTLDKPVEASVKCYQPPGVTDSFFTMVACKYNTGGHGQRCKSSHPAGADKIGDGVLCPYAFDYPHVIEFFERTGKTWQMPSEIERAITVGENALIRIK